jgi:hypothetical protein
MVQANILNKDQAINFLKTLSETNQKEAKDSNEANISKLANKYISWNNTEFVVVVEKKKKSLNTKKILLLVKEAVEFLGKEELEKLDVQLGLLEKRVDKSIINKWGERFFAIYKTFCLFFCIRHWRHDLINYQNDCKYKAFNKTSS